MKHSPKEVQDYLAQQLPYKAKAEIAMKQGKYQKAAESIIDFMIKCVSVERLFDINELKVFEVLLIGYNNAALTMNRIIELTAKKIINPVYDNPYQEERTLQDDANVPESVAILSFRICAVSANYSYYYYYKNPSIQSATALLSSMNLLASAGFYYNTFEKKDIRICEMLINKAQEAATLWMEKIPDDTVFMELVQNYNFLCGMFCQHIAMVLSIREKKIQSRICSSCQHITRALTGQERCSQLRVCSFCRYLTNRLNDFGTHLNWNQTGKDMVAKYVDEDIERDDKLNIM
jgi:hypothetical protein